MARPLWKGSVSFGLVTVPVGVYSAVQRMGELSFRLLHEKDSSPVDYKRVCQEEGVEVPWGEIVKGYEHAKGQYVVVTDDDFEKARVPASDTIAITDFVPDSAIDFEYFEQPYYLAPEGRGGTKAYALLRDALAETKRVGVGTIVMRQREHLVAIEPVGDVLAMTTMRWSHEIRSPKELDLPKAGAGWQKKEMDLAKRLVDSLAADWEPEKYRDTYRDVLMKAIEQKVEGKEIEIPEPSKPKRVVNLVKALEQSLKTPRKELARADGRKPRAAAHGKVRRAARRRAA
jgi:DNA end-binding protein Ku